MHFSIAKKFLLAVTVRSFSSSSSTNTMSKLYQVRRGGIPDLPQIHLLIKESYSAMNEYFPDKGFQEMMAKSAQSSCDGELSEKEFEKVYFSSYGFHFWVVEECKSGDVCGCVGLKRCVIMLLFWFHLFKQKSFLL